MFNVLPEMMSSSSSSSSSCSWSISSMVVGRSVSELSSCISLGEQTVSLLLATARVLMCTSRLFGELVARDAARRPGVRVEVRADGVTAELLRAGVLAELR